MRFLKLVLAMAGLMMALFHPAIQAQTPAAENPQAEAAEPDPAFQWEGRITDPTISTAELSHLLVPLTKQQLESVSGEWLKIVQDKTSEISLLQAERVRIPPRFGTNGSIGSFHWLNSGQGYWSDILSSWTRWSAKAATKPW